MARYQSNPQEKNWVSLCATCGREVSNAAYFAGRQGSSHFKGTCKVPAWVNVKERELERETLKPWNVFKTELFRVDYDACYSAYGRNKGKRIFPKIETAADLCKWWDLPSIGEASQPKGKAKEALAKMGLAA